MSRHADVTCPYTLETILSNMLLCRFSFMNLYLHVIMQIQFYELISTLLNLFFLSVFITKIPLLICEPSII